MRIKLTILFILSIAFSQAQNASFTASTDKIMLGDSVKLSWKVENVKNVTDIQIRKLKENLATEGSIYVKPKETRKYFLKVFTKKAKHRLGKVLKINVEKPSINFFKTQNIDNTDEDSTTVLWETSNCETVTMNGKNVAKSGQRSFLFLKDTILHIKAYNKNNILVEKALHIPIRQIEYLKGNDRIYLLDTLRLDWKFKMCTKVNIKGLNKDFKAEDYALFIPEKDTTYNLIIFKNNGLKEQKFFTVHVASPIVKFSLAKIAFKNFQSLVQWEVKKGFRVEFTGAGKRNTKRKGIVKIPADISKPYTLKVYDKANVKIFEETKKIKRIVSPIKRFRVPSVGVQGSPVKIYWEAYKGFSVRITGIGDKLPYAGKLEITPQESTTYNMIVSRRGKDLDTISRQIEIIKRRDFVKKVKDISELPKKAEINFDIFAIDESNYPNEVKLYVVAVDKEGNFIKGLAGKNMRRTKKIIKKLIDQVGSEKSNVKNFTFKEVREEINYPYDISLALDYSGSMYGAIDSLENAVHTFISNKHSTDRISILRFDQNFVNVSKLDNNKDSLLNKFTINGLDSLGGATALYAGGDFAIQSNKDSKNNKVLILFTDGMDNSSMRYFEDYAFSATTLAKKAKRAKVKVHVVAYGDGVNNKVLEKLAYTTGGKFYKLKLKSDINAVFKELPIILRNFYVLSYKPISKKGKHTVQIEYDNLKGKNVILQNNYQVGTNFEIEELGKDYLETYWIKAAKELQMSPISVPQAVAFFDLNKVNLLDKYKKSLDIYFNFLNKNRNASVLIFGHTDSKGNDNSCIELGQKRAESVKEYLMSLGLDENRIHTYSYGKRELIWYPEDADWKARENRRIEILLVE